MMRTVSQRQGRLVLAAIVSIATIAVYLPALRNEFVNWDDYTYVVDNLHIRTLDWAFFRWAFTDMSTDYWLPLAWISHALDHALWGLDPVGHHLTSVLLHGANTFIVAWLIARLLDAANAFGIEARSLPLLSERSILITSGLTGILFGLHPIHVESVAWVAERKDLLYAFFFLLSILAYTRFAGGRRAGGSGEGTSGPPRERGGGGFYVLSLSLFALSLASKPMAVTLPVVLLLLDWYPLGRLELSKRSLPVLMEKVPFAALSLAASLVAVTGQRASGAIIPLDSIPFADRVAEAVGALAVYLWNMAVPVRLLPFYPIDYQTGWVLLSIAAAGGITIAALVLIRRQPGVLACWGYYCICLLPVLGLVRVGTVLIADRFTYVAALGPFLLVAAGVSRFWSKADASGQGGPRFTSLGVTLLAALVLVLGYGTLKQIAFWKDSLTLWNRVIEQVPDRAPLAYNNRGLFLKEQGKLDEAIADYDRAIMLNPNYSHPYTNRGIVFAETGQADRAIEDFNRAIALDPNYADTYRWRGLSFKAAGQFQRAVDDLTRAIALSPQNSRYHVDRAMLLKEGGRAGDAEVDLTTAIELNPSDPITFVQRGMLFKDTGRYEQAIRDYDRAVELNPASVEAYNNRGVAFKYLNQLDRALSDYDAAISLNPSFYLAYMNRGVVFSMQGQVERAIADYSTVLSLKADFAAAYLFRGELYRTAAQKALAKRDFQKACELGNEDGCRALRGTWASDRTADPVR